MSFQRCVDEEIIERLREGNEKTNFNFMVNGEFNRENATLKTESITF